ncbi:discoidin domain-containing protein [Longispora urticae]
MRLFRRTGLIAVLATLLLVALGAPPAHAELEHPRQAYLRDATGGLFLHWGMRTSPGYTSCTAWENAVTSGGWDPGYWVAEAKKLHTRYLVLATFHSRLGYARPWPSAIPGSCSTRRDFLGELITAANADGLKVILYMTDDPQWHAEGGHEWLDSAAYSAHKGRDVDLTGREGFGEFSQENFVEVMARYPKLSGFWIDNDNAYWESHGLYQQIRADRPSFTLSNNNEDTPIMDMISNEQKTGMTPAYDYPQAVYTAAPRLIEADFKLPSTGAWWYGGTDSAVDYQLTLGRLLTNTGSSIKSLMAETAMVDGRFPPKQEAFNDFAAGYLDRIWESVGGTEGGGYGFGGLQPGSWNDGAHGVTTVSRTNPDLHYVHVLTRPSTGTLTVRDNGYQVSRVSDLRTGAAVAFTQGGGSLRLTGLTGWDPYDTVFKVETAGRQGIYPPASVTETATASASGHAASAAGDGDHRTYWDSDRTTPVSLHFDLGAAKKVQYLGINQREDSVSYPRSATEQSARIKDFRVYVSADGTTWGSPVRTGSLPSRRGVQFVDLPATTARHVRLEVVSTHAASSDPTRYRRLRVDEAWVGADYAGSPRYEAESAVVTRGAVESNHAGYSGTGFVNYDNVVGGAVRFTVQAPAAGPATLTLRYANGTTVNRPMDVKVNGVVVAAGRAFGPTANWDTWANTSLTVTLAAGPNTIEAVATTADGGPNLDYADVGPA